METKTLTFGKVSGSGRPYGVLTVTETATSTEANTSTVSIKLTLKREHSYTSTATKHASCTINGETYTWSGTIGGGTGDLLLISKQQTIQHNSDGTKTINISASIEIKLQWSTGYIDTISGSGTMALTNIPRYGTAVQSLASKTETSITMNWSSNATVDYIWYSTNNGSSWTGINVTDGTSGSYTVSGLSANTAYNVKTRIRRKDSQLTTDSTALSVTTYNYPYANSMPNFTIGNELTLGFYNPLKRTITVNIIGADNSQISNVSISGTSSVGYTNETVVNNLYASIPNAQSGTYKVKVTYGSVVTTKTGGTYSVNRTVCAPAIDTAAYEDINSAVTAITGDNQKIVQNLSQVRYTATGLSAKKSATLQSCSVSVNNSTQSLTISGSTATGGNAVIDSESDVTATITVTDSRGLTASKTVTVQMCAWSVPSAIISLQRHSNYYSETDLTVDANYSYVDGLNSVTIKYRKKKEGDSWSGVTYTTISDNVQTTFTADNNYRWDVQVVVTDAFGGTVTYNLSLQVGMPIIFFDSTKLSTGFNCFPKEEKSVEIGGYSIARSVMTRSLSADAGSLTTSAYTPIALDQDTSFGTKLTAGSNGGIVVGSNVHKVLVSACVTLTSASAGARQVRVVKNSYASDVVNANTVAWRSKSMQASEIDQIVITPMLVDVQAGDVLYLTYYTTQSADAIVGYSDMCRTEMTVEAVA